MEPLNTTQLENIMHKHLPNVFKGVFPSDHLPKTHNYSLPWCLICNSECSHTKGSHWLSFYADTNKTLHYFDSYGKQPQKTAWIDFLERNSRSKHWVMQRRKIQSEFSAFCGYYTIYFLLKRHSTPLSVTDYRLMLNVDDSNIIEQLENILKKQYK